MAEMCGEHTCPVCSGKFFHALAPGHSCFQVMGPMKWKLCDKCFGERASAPLPLGDSAGE
jgi:hypothetical protein